MTRRVAVGKNADGTMQFYEYSLEPKAGAKPPTLVALTTASLYGANPQPDAHTVLPPKRYLPENKKKIGPGNSVKLSQVNAAPVSTPPLPPLPSHLPLPPAASDGF
jgi:hypothetical protein